ncbi:hypothetical protein CHU92_00125 [Flavobacterium cyanobacteriorum]|uniref:DUF3887 domain-containing protein n=1 Tax=Flavobacterium cyanobacteriorum TaxID=2022802 RepID=A0A256AB44_9FLAO|nr:hypothetical protein [Flavobacterium cyanobacteriorum]OYQ50370.1 hypothetical protein CHU92_00125 [Flavobacterium cyanobacteriorum]
MKKGVLLVIIFLLSGCNLNATFTNEEHEKNEAEKVVNNFYALLYLKDYKITDKLFSNHFFEKVNKDQFQRILENNQEKLGDILSNNLIDWKTFRVEGTNAKSEYVLIYEVVYTKFKTIEKIEMVKEENVIKIIGYHVNSDGFKY